MMHPELNDRPLRIGEGWRVGFMPNTQPYSALVGGDQWAVELTVAEWKEFCAAIRQIELAISSLPEQLMEGESVTLEQGTDRLLVIATGLLPALELYLQVKTGRKAEGYWPAAALPGLFDAVRRLDL